MARKQFIIRFSDIEGVQHSVTIAPTSGTISETVIIQNGDVSPLTIDEDASDDMLTGLVRGRTGYLNIVEPNYGDFDEIYPLLPKDMKVTTYGFFGYLQPQTFSNDWDDGPRIISLPILSPMSTIRTVQSGAVSAILRLTIRQMLVNIISQAGYDKVIFPKGLGDGDGIINSYTRSLTVCPYNEDKEYQYTLQTLYAPKTNEEILEAICNRFGLLCHDHNTGDSASTGVLVFSKFDYIGQYQQWTEDQLDTEGEIPTTLAITGDTVRNFYDYFQIRSDKNKESIIAPYSKITYNQEGEQYDNVVFPVELSKFTGNTYTLMSFAHAMLEPVGGWLVSSMLSSSSLAAGTVSLCGIFDTRKENQQNAQEYIHTNMRMNAPQDLEMFRLHLLATPRYYYVSGIVKAYTTSAGYVTSPDATKFGLAVKCGNYYWDWDEDAPGWKTSPIQQILEVTPNSEGKFQTMGMDQPDDDWIGNVEYYDVIFYHDPARDVYNYPKIFGDLTLHTNVYVETNKYTKREVNAPIVVTGTYGSMEDAEVNQLFSRNQNTNYMTLVGGYFSDVNNSYLLSTMKKREITVKRTGIFDYTHYLCKWSFGDDYTWRLVTVQDDVAECTRKLLFFGSKNI